MVIYVTQTAAVIFYAFSCIYLALETFVDTGFALEQ